MPTGSGITTDTPVNLVVGAGVLLKDHAYVGATIDNNMFAVERTLFTPELNGSMYDLMGTDYITKSRPRLEATVPEVGEAVFGSSLPGTEVDNSTPGMTVLQETGERRIPDSDYHEYELDVPRLNGGQFQFEIDGAINTGNFEGELQDDGLFAPRLILSGRASVAQLLAQTSPWRIRILDTAS
jgi:hypothetical protein